MSDDDIKKLFWSHNDKDPKGVYADEVNIMDFGRKVEAAARAEERQRIIDIARQHSPSLAALL